MTRKEVMSLKILQETKNFFGSNLSEKQSVELSDKIANLVIKELDKNVN